MVVRQTMFLWRARRRYRFRVTGYGVLILRERRRAKRSVFVNTRERKTKRKQRQKKSCRINIIYLKLLSKDTLVLWPNGKASDYESGGMSPTHATYCEWKLTIVDSGFEPQEDLQFFLKFFKILKKMPIRLAN